MTAESRHIGEWIDRPPEEVYQFVADPVNLPRWAHGLGSALELADGHWVAETAAGRVGVEFAPRNSFGVLDHDVRLPTGEVVHNPMRVIGAGRGAEVVFTLRRRPGMSEADVERDAQAVAADLVRLKRLLETR